VSRVENWGNRRRGTGYSLTASLVPASTATDIDGIAWGGVRGSLLRVVWVQEFCHEPFISMISDGSVLRRHSGRRHSGRPHDNRVPPGLVMVQFNHQNGGLHECTWTGGNITCSWMHLLGVFSAEAVLEEELEASRHGSSLAKREGTCNKVWEVCRRLRDRDDVAGPLATGGG